VHGRDRDLLVDTGLGHFSLRDHVALVSERPLVCVASPTHFDHIGCHHELGERCVHFAEAAILADPRNEWTLADR
jgi:glyoxylase-like metal-dependent hydrolase (beta-lactamase superfamily II)